MTASAQHAAHRYRLGVDLGSVSLKVVLLDGERIVFEKWMRVETGPLDALESLLTELAALHPEASITAGGATGSGRSLVAGLLDAREVNEISAHARAVALLHPKVNSIVEIGGQDSKLILFGSDGDGEGRPVAHFAMNEVCAAGTGAFLDQQAARLRLSLDEFARLGLESTTPVRIAGRCAVFAKTDMTHHQQEGRPLADIVAGLNEALVRTYLSNLVRGRTLPVPIAFQGGVARNAGLVAAFRRLLKLGDNDLIVPRYHGVMGAIGAALIAAKTSGGGPRPLADILDRVRDHARQRGARKHDACLARLKRDCSHSVEPDFSALAIDGAYLGIDVGSVSVKMALLGPDGLVRSDYRFSDGRPLDVLRSMLASVPATNLAGVGVTGSGRQFVGALIGADTIENEITAQARAAAVLLPGVDTVVEIGGQDAKFIRLDGHRPMDFAMNRVCAAGTGAFLQEQAARLGVAIEDEFASEAFEATAPAALGARCTVFMESDLVAHRQEGVSTRDLIAGLAYSVVENYLDRVVAGRKIGERVLFLGGVAENRAVVAALSSKLGRCIATSRAGKLSGAIGAALAAVEAKRRGAYTSTAFSLDNISAGVETFLCEHCANACAITRLRGDGTRYFGGRCGRWDGHKPDRLSVASLPRRRMELLETATAGHWDTGVRRIGIPRALMAFDRLTTWRTFLEALGFEVVLSPATNDAILRDGGRRQVVETCLPVKAFCAHLVWLEDQGRCDALFVPSLVSTGVDRHAKETLHCPFVQSAAQFAQPVTTLPLVNPVINAQWRPEDDALSMVEAVECLGIDRAHARQAWEAAVAADQRFRNSIRAWGDEVLAKLGAGKLTRAFVLLGKDYNICDPRLNCGVERILSSRGECVITQDMIAGDDGAYSAAYRTMYWSHSKEILAAADLSARTPGLYAILITSFGCGPDSFTTRWVHDIMGDKPMLVVEVDEHSSAVGVETRIEAFLDALPEAPRITSKPSRGAVGAPHGIRRVYVPNFSDHALAFAAAVRGLGLEPVLTDPPDNRAAHAGMKGCTGGECHPFALLLGGYMQAAGRERGANDACYLIPETALCRLGQFGTQMRLVADDLGLTLPVYTRFEELAAVGKVGMVRAGLDYWRAIRGVDFLLQKLFETRAREVTPGSADKVYREARATLVQAMLHGHVKEGLRAASAALDDVQVDRGRRLLKIAITGDYYTRISDYANADMFRHIERMGGVVMLPPTLSEFVKYRAHSAMKRAVLNWTERDVRKLFGDSIDYDVPLDYERGMKLVEPYMSAKMPVGLTGSVAAIVEQSHAGADGILNLITLHCSYGLVLSSVLASIDRDYPRLPKLTLIFEGLRPTHNLTRLEAFMERVRERSPVFG